ncbi:VWA domain-containing protein [Actinophytocola oryzae]|uniref:VWA domain containing CoxE-like protein n=1 Tax=Actinophytocola oryzae TaxID=502181 RepID=A0A4R7VV54_9PSEU|nr:VWA domain-containing protein [Actinophytocola oryzae]TDV53886.1 VWA domain containing CoxE-like protein [Actinophytocola oryzae]
MSERLRRWRMILGGEDADGTGTELSGVDAKRDSTLKALYDRDEDRRGGLGNSSPRVARWLGDIRGYFPSSVVQVMQRDAMERLGLRELLLEPELLESVQPDVHLVGTLLSLNHAIPERSRDTARAVVRKVVDDLEKRLAQPTRQAVTGALHRANRTNRPRQSDIDWNRTILKNLKHYQPDHHTVVPERLVGYGRRLPNVSKQIVLCLDQSGSMASSVVYASVFGAVLASIRSLRTQIIAFDTSVVDLTDSLTDPVELLFGIQLGGGTDINAALAYCQTRIETPRDTVLVLVTDLYEGGNEEEMMQRAQALKAEGVQVVCLLALSDDGAPAYDHDNAAALAAMGIPTFACTPDKFPDLMSTAIQNQDITTWAAANDIPVAAPADE